MPEFFGKTEIAFVDPSIDDLAHLLAGLRPEVEAVVLDAGRPAAGQIAAALAGRTAGQVHIVSHGAPGVVAFTGGALSAESIHEFAEDLSAIGAALGNEGALSLWSCRTAEGERGSAFVAALARAAGVAVAASCEPVGSAAKGGTWTLTGSAQPAQPPLRAPVLETYEGVMTINLDLDTSDNIIIDWGGGNETSSYNENAGATSVLSNVSISTPGSHVVQQITVAISGYNGTESLSLSSATSGLTWSFNSLTGILTITATGASPGDSTWTSALNKLRFSDPLNDNLNSSRSISVTASDNGGHSETKTLTINTNDANDAPVLTPATDTHVYTQNDAAFQIMANGAVSDVDVPNDFDNGFLTFTITDAQGGDRLHFMGVEGLSLVGGIVYDGGMPFATISAGGVGAGNTTVTFFFNDDPLGKAYDASVEKLLANLGYSSTSLVAGDRHVLVTFNDGGNDGGGALSDSSIITITQSPADNTPTDAPVIVSVTDNVGPITGVVPSGGYTDDNVVEVKVSVTGTGAVAGDKLQLFNDGVYVPGSDVILTATHIANGYVYVAGLTGGEITYNLTAKITDQANNVSDPSAVYQFTLDVTDPTFAGPTNPSVNVAENTPETTLVYDATADGDTGVTYTLGGADAGDFEIHAITGEVRFINSPDYESPTDAGGNNVYNVDIIATDQAGNSSTRALTVNVTDVEETPTDITLSGNTIVEHQPVGTVVAFLGAVDDDNGETFTFALTNTTGYPTQNDQFTIVGNQLRAAAVFDYDTRSSFTVEITVTDSSGNKYVELVPVEVVDPYEPVITINPLAPTNDTTPTITGTADEPGRTINLYEGDFLLGSATIAANGTWSITTLPISLNGDRTVTARVVDKAGNVGEAQMTFVLDTVAPVVTIDNAGGPTNDSTQTLVGTAEPNDEVVIFDNGVQIGTTTSDANGDWSFNVTVGFGGHSYVAKQTDVAGNTGQSNGGAGLAFVLDLTPPTVAITSPGGPTNDGAPDIVGTAEAGATVEIYVNGALTETTTADGSGNWSVTNSALQDGANTVQAKAIDAAGNSTNSNTVAFTLDTDIPVVAISTTTKGVNNANQTIQGSGTVGTTVRVYDDGVLAGTTTVGANGLWSAVIALNAQGANVVTAQAEDSAGNDSASSNAVTLTLDSIAPAVAITSTGGDVLQASQIIQGTAEIGALVQLRENGQVVGSAVANAAGEWSITVNLGAVGESTFSATATDAAGNVGNGGAVTYDLQLTPGGGGGLADDLTVAEAFLAIMREPVAGEWVPFVNALQAKVDIGQIDIEDAVNQIIDEADDTTSVATLTYQFFTGEVPTAAGLDFLVSPTGPNDNTLNDAYYQSFSLENRYINFAVNLGVLGDGKADFQADYGALTLDQATAKAYLEIFGTAADQAKVDAILDATVTSNGQSMTRAEYFATYGGDGLTGIGTKAAMVGWLLAEAAKADTGVYAEVNELFLFDIADGGTFNVDIVGVYGGLIDG